MADQTTDGTEDTNVETDYTDTTVSADGTETMVGDTTVPAEDTTVPADDGSDMPVVEAPEMADQTTDGSDDTTVSADGTTTLVQTSFGYIPDLSTTISADGLGDADAPTPGIPTDPAAALPDAPALPDYGIAAPVHPTFD